jgi:asparagine synthase (glutamine-hydrolysing)
MCGVAGVFHYGELDRRAEEGMLLRMAARLRHRGPDDAGLYLDGPLGLVHRRLSIVDLSELGHQPMSTPDGCCTLCYNGELYNHGEFRGPLAAHGITFRGTSDTETLLHLLRQRGPAALAQAAGIFGLAFWDARERTLLLARDPLGVKQLYYHDDGRRLVFASEIKALFECAGVPRDIDTQAVNEYLHFHTALFDRTFFRGIRQVRPGEYIRVCAAGISSHTYWSVDEFDTQRASADSEVEALRACLQTIVPEQLMSDVPTGAFFSGGIDSSAIAAFAAAAGHRLPCFGVHFSGQEVVDERPYQEAAARALGLDLHLITLDGGTFPSDFSRLMYAQDQPVLGAAMFPMDKVSQLAAEHVTVCLGGQGADEVFGGYARYSVAQPLQLIKSLFARSGQANGSMGVRGNLWKQLLDRRALPRFGRIARDLASWKRRYFNTFAKVSEPAWNRLFADGVVSRDVAWQQFSQTVDRSPARSPAHKAMHWDMQTYLAGLFHQDDRMSMQWSLESRVPLADPRLVKHAFAVPYSLKVRNGASKWLLRAAVADVLPAVVLNRKKVGFDTPAERWMRDVHGDYLRDLLLSREARQRGLWNPSAVERLLASPREPFWFDQMWKVACVECWATIYIDGDPSEIPLKSDTTRARAVALAGSDAVGRPAGRRETA